MENNPWKNRPAPAGENRPGRRPGWGMIAVGWALALIVATVFFGDLLDRRHNPNRAATLDAQSGELVLRQNAAGHYLAEGTVNGQAAVFLLDTGATSVAVPADQAAAFGLEPGAPIQIVTANGAVQARKTRIENLRVGPLQLQDIAAVVAPDMPGGAILLGMSALSNWDFNQTGDILTLRPAKY